MASCNTNGLLKYYADVILNGDNLISFTQPHSHFDNDDSIKRKSTNIMAPRTDPSFISIPVQVNGSTSDVVKNECIMENEAEQSVTSQQVSSDKLQSSLVTTDNETIISSSQVDHAQKNVQNETVRDKLIDYDKAIQNHSLLTQRLSVCSQRLYHNHTRALSLLTRLLACNSSASEDELLSTDSLPSIISPNLTYEDTESSTDDEAEMKKALSSSEQSWLYTRSVTHSNWHWLCTEIKRAEKCLKNLYMLKNNSNNLEKLSQCQSSDDNNIENDDAEVSCSRTSPYIHTNKRKRHTYHDLSSPKCIDVIKELHKRSLGDPHIKCSCIPPFVGPCILCCGSEPNSDHMGLADKSGELDILMSAHSLCSHIHPKLSVPGASGVTDSSRFVSNQILKEFQKFQDLIRRPIAAEILQPERELLLGYLEVSLKEFHEEFLSRSSSTNASSHQHSLREQSQKKSLKIITNNISDCINQILWGGQLKCRVQEDFTFVKFFLSDLQRFNAYEQEALNLIEQIEEWHNEQFQKWSRDRLSSLSTNKDSNQSSLAFDLNGPLLNLSTVDGHLEVGFPDGLAQLQREVRLLAGLGYPIPSKLIQATNQAEKISQYAVMLRQVAHFYNSIDSEMLPFQKPLMLNSALAFERLIKSQSNKQNFSKENLLNSITTTTSDEIQPVVQQYILQLQQATQQLIFENRRLRKVHYILIERIIKLLDIDLLRNQCKWRNELNEMRYQLSEIATSGNYPTNHMAAWRAFLDYQLYKVLEYQYRRGLEELNERMPEMRVDMVYLQSCLTFRPPFEEIKAKYYRELKKFICIPNNFRGFNEHIQSAGDTNYITDSTDSTTTTTTNTTTTSTHKKHIFSSIIDNQESALRICYKKAEFLFTRLFGSLKQFQDWVILGSINLDDFVDTHCRDLEDFEKNFKTLKIRSRDAEKLPTEIRIDCIVVNCLPVRMAINGLLQNLFDTLQNCLRRSIHGDLIAADGFLTDSLEKLSNRPQTIDELIEAKSQYNEYSKILNNLHEQIQCADKKNQLLCTISGNGVTTINTIKTKWEKFNTMMESFQFIMNEQLEILKSSVINETNVYLNNLERFKTRWNQLKPGKNVSVSDNNKNNELGLSVITIIKEHETEFRELEQMHQKLIRDYEYFDMPKPEFTLVTELANDLNHYSAMWLEYDNFCQELQNYAKEDWISFKSRYYVFEEFLTEWSNKIRSLQPTPMTVRLQKEIDQFMNLIPVLKWLKGDHLTRDHWFELFRLIGLPKESKLENLLFGDFFPIISNIIHQSDALKSLSQRAQAEIVVREALHELDLWGASTTFTLTEYIDSSGQTVYLVKDWKDIVSQVGDNMALLASLHDSPYIDSFSDRSNAWAQRLSDLDYCLTRFQSVQRKWVYLEPIMGRGSLPKETARYAQIDEEFRRLLGYLKVDSRVVSLVSGMKGKALKDTLNNLQIIQDALKCGTPQINLLGHTVNVDPNSGIFITLNPIAKGYGGRQKLPDNLKQLFRPISMTEPDIDLIAEMILFSEGFFNAQLLGRKLVSIFSLAKQLLSVQQHYDWGLRALKTILRCAGKVLNAHKQNYYTNKLNNHDRKQFEQNSYDYEARIVIQVTKTNTLAKLTDDDAQRFENLIHDVFPDFTLHNVPFENQELAKLIDSMHSVIKEHHMILIDVQIQKAIELYEQLSQRMGVVLVGPSGSGKSTVLNLLRLALNKMGMPVRSHIFNPKSMLRVQLLGRIDADTREWTDGVLTQSARCIVKESMDQKCWIIADGDIDPEWIESLNSVLDDNHLLTLPNGERIQFDTNVNFLFETHELIHASPATISRMGVIYMSDKAVDPHALVEAWLMHQPDSEQNQLKRLIDSTFYQCLEWVYEKNEFVVDTSSAAIIFNGLSHLVGAITPALFTVGLIRGLGANLTESARNELAMKVYEATGENPPDITRPLNVQVSRDFFCHSHQYYLHVYIYLVL
ncbi:unnamed protein product [Schistosoma turkestanicum]|nr:unnamed protein product [Schistosoma turkestanicum]